MHAHDEKCLDIYDKFVQNDHIGIAKYILYV